MRFLVWIVALCACDGGGGKRKPRPDARVVVRIDATPVDARDNLPAALGPLQGELAGKPFTPAKGYLWVTAQGADLMFHAKAEGGPCEHQFAPDDDDLYLSVKFPARDAQAGGGAWSETKGAFAMWKKPTLDPVDDTFELVLDTYDVAAGRVTGRLRVVGEDGTRVEGAFDAALCVSPQRTLPAGEVNGISWRDDPPRPAELPSAPIAALHLGDAIVPAAIELVDASQSMSTQHELHVWRDAPPAPCTLDFGVGFNLALGQDPLVERLTVQQRLTLSHPPGKPFGIVTWREVIGAQGMEGNGEVSLAIDEITDTEVRGRVVATFDDPAKSMVAGAFTARRCR